MTHVTGTRRFCELARLNKMEDPAALSVTRERLRGTWQAAVKFPRIPLKTLIQPLLKPLESLKVHLMF
jgi:hypothetical protein